MEKYAGVSGFQAGTDGETLLVTMNDPRKTKVWIKSKDAWTVYGKPGGKKPMCIFEPPTFKIEFQDGTSVIWSAKLGKDEQYGDYLLYDLVRQATN